MNRWSWRMAIALGVCMLGFVGCGGGDDDGEDGELAAATADAGSTTTGGTTSAGGTTTTGGTTTSPATTTGGTTILADVQLANLESSMPPGDLWVDSSGYVAPANGVISLQVSWSAQPSDGNDYPLAINLGGVVVNGSASSPAELRAGASAGSTWGFTLENNNSVTLLVRVKVIWSAN